MFREGNAQSARTVAALLIDHNNFRHAGLDAGAEGKHSAQEIARASLRLHFPAVRSFLNCTGRIEEYVAEHCDTWVQSFKAKKLPRKKILFVYGFIKTSAWQATAWEQSNDEVEASVWVRVQSFAGLGGKMASKRSRAMTQRTSDDPGRKVSMGGNLPKDSCIFLDVYRPLARHVLMQRLKNSLLPHAKQRSLPDLQETAEKHPAPPSSDRGPRSQVRLITPPDSVAPELQLILMQPVEGQRCSGRRGVCVSTAWHSTG